MNVRCVVVLLAMQGEDLSVCLRKRTAAPRKGRLELLTEPVDPQRDSRLADTAERVLREQACLHANHLEQLITNGTRSQDQASWSLDVVYLALASLQQLGEPADKSTAAALSWHSCNSLPPMPAAEIALIDHAVERLRSDARHSSLPLLLLPRTFTLSQAQRVYESVRGQRTQPATFRRFICALQAIGPSPSSKAPSRAASRPASTWRVTQERPVTINSMLKFNGNANR